MKTLWLKNKDIPTLTSFSGNIDADQLLPYVYIAQTTEMKRILGIDLYNKIDSSFQEGTALTGDYKKIYDDYIVDILTYYSCAKYMSFGGIKITNVGIFKMTSPETQNLEQKDVENLIGRMTQLGAQCEVNFYEYINTLEIQEWKKNSETESNLFIPWF